LPAQVTRHAAFRRLHWLGSLPVAVGSNGTGSGPGACERNIMSTMSNLEAVTHRRLGVLLVVVGLVAAAGSHLNVPVVYDLWPLLTVGLGIGFLGMFAGRRAKGTVYLAMGEYLILFSGLAFYCNFTSWRCLKHLWPLFVAFLGVVFATVLVFNRRSRFLLFLALLSLFMSASLFVIFTYGSEYWWSAPALAGLGILVSGIRR